MDDFIQWWQAADYAAKFTVIGGFAAVLALIWSFFSGSSRSKIMASNGGLAGNSIKNSTITTNVSPKDENSPSEKT